MAESSPAALARESLLAAHQSFYAAIESADVDLLQALWLPGDDTVCIHPGAEPVVGTAAILRSWSLLMANISYIQFFLTDVEVAMHGTGPGLRLGVVSCTENMLSAPGRESLESFAGGRAVATNTFVRTEIGWRMVAHHASPLLERQA